MVAATAMHGGMQPCPLLSPSPARARVSTHFATTTCKNLGQADPKGVFFFLLYSQTTKIIMRVTHGAYLLF